MPPSIGHAADNQQVSRIPEVTALIPNPMSASLKEPMLAQVVYLLYMQIYV